MKIKKKSVIISQVIFIIIALIGFFVIITFIMSENKKGEEKIEKAEDKLKDKIDNLNF